MDWVNHLLKANGYLTDIYSEDGVATVPVLSPLMAAEYLHTVLDQINVSEDPA
jgi:hypothetical protein